MDWPSISRSDTIEGAWNKAPYRKGDVLINPDENEAKVLRIFVDLDYNQYWFRLRWEHTGEKVVLPEGVVKEEFHLIEEA